MGNPRAGSVSCRDSPGLYPKHHPGLLGKPGHYALSDERSDSMAPSGRGTGMCRFLGISASNSNQTETPRIRRFFVEKELRAQELA